VDGSSTGTRVPWMWVLLMLPRFGGANHASGHNHWSRYRQVGISVHGIDAEGNVLMRRQLKRRYVLAFSHWRQKTQKRSQRGNYGH
jgi:hypothetical protein